MNIEYLLAGIALFNSLPPDDLSWLASKFHRRNLKPGEILFNEGDEGHELFVLAEGRVLVSMSGAAGESIELARLEPGSFFGEMAIIEQAFRSASCTAIDKVLCLSLSDDDFEALVRERPELASRILQRMLEISSARLLNTGTFLSQMVRWGDDARRRAVSDEATGLFNRRYLDESLDSKLTSAQRDGQNLCVAMFDLDHFGALNTQYGPTFCDRIIVRIAEVMKQVFHKDDILVRYGGDEFCFVLPRPPVAAYAACQRLCSALRSLQFPEFPNLNISCSIGLACLQAGDVVARDLLDRADRALYEAKENGRDRVAVLPLDALQSPFPPRAKQAIDSLPQRNRILDALLRLIQERESFLIFGHKNPDEDCFSSMVAFALLLRKFNKQVQLFLTQPFPSNLSFMADICSFNQVKIIDREPEAHPDTMILLDTPKADMIDGREVMDSLRITYKTPLVEFDHHLEADCDLSGDEGLSLVMEASSTCEIIALFLFKLAARPAVLQKENIKDLFSRNIVLAVLGGMIGDSGMGKYLKSRRVRWFYHLYTRKLEEILSMQTIHGSGNMATKEQVFNTLVELSDEEKSCLAIMEDGIVREESLHWIFLNSQEYLNLAGKWGSKTVLSAIKILANSMAESSGKLGFAGYCEGNDDSALLQFRLRRAANWTGLDLRNVLEILGMEDGGGHAGAVAFRCKLSDVAQPEDYLQKILEGLRTLLEEYS